MPLGKNTLEVSLNGGNDIQLKINNTWTNIGHLLTGEVVDETDSVDVTFHDGNGTTLDGKRVVQLVLKLGQTSKAVLELIDDLRGLEVEGYYNNGKVGVYWQEYYFKALRIIPKKRLGAPGTPKALDLVFAVQPQASNVSVTPDTGLPTNAYAEGESPIAGKNKYYVILETDPDAE